MKEMISVIDAITSLMEEGFLFVDPKGNVLLLNAHTRKILGIDEEAPVSAEELQERLEKLGLSAIVEETTFRKVTVDYPSPKVYEVLQRPVFGEEQKKLGCVSLFRDRSLEREMEQIKNEFVSTVSHELKTPLTIIQAAVGNLHDGIIGTLSPQQSRVVAITYNNITRLGRLINDLLDFSRLGAGKIKPHPSRIHLNDFVEEALSKFHTLAAEKKISLEIDMPELPSVYADAPMIAQVLWNLFDNAFRYAKSRVFLKGRHVKLTSAKEAVQISIIDDGQGIAPEAQKRLFNKFEQFARSPGGAGYKGTGLGLAICKEIITRHGGKIWMENEKEKGSQFHFTLPLKTEKENFDYELQNIFQEAKNKNKTFALLALSIRNIEQIQKQLGEKKEKFFKKIAEQIRSKVLRRNDPIFHYTANDFFIILSEADQAGLASAKKRLKESLKAFCSFDGEKVFLEFRVSSALYPKEGANPKKLIEKILRGVKSKLGDKVKEAYEAKEKSAHH